MPDILSEYSRFNIQEIISSSCIKFGNFLNDYQPHSDGSWRDKNNEDYTTDELFNLFIEETYK